MLRRVSLGSIVFAVLVVAGIAMLAAARAAPGPGSPSDGLVAYWSFTGGNLRDETRSHNDAYVETVGPVPTADRFGKQNNAYAFNGIDQYLRIADSRSLDLGTSDYTVAAWIRTANSSNDGRIFSKGSWNCTTGYMMRLGGDRVHLESAQGGTCLVNFDSSSVVTDGSWHLVVGVVDRDVGAQLWVDGRLDGSQVIDTGAFDLTNSANPTIGVSDPVDPAVAPLEFFAGAIDDVRIYKRALSANDVRDLYLKTAPAPVPKPVNRPVYSALLDYEAGWAAGTNPHGVWSYGWSMTLTAPLTLYTRAYVPPVDNGACQFWDDPNQTKDWAPAVSRNFGGDYNDGNVTFTAGRLALHHGDGGTYSHVVFTAPSAGLYTVAATFFAQQNGINADVNVLVNGKVKYSDTITSNGMSRSYGKLFLLKAGQTVDFAVGPNGDMKQHAGWTGLEAVITGGLTQPE